MGRPTRKRQKFFVHPPPSLFLRRARAPWMLLASRPAIENRGAIELALENLALDQGKEKLLVLPHDADSCVAGDIHDCVVNRFVIWVILLEGEVF